METPLAPRLIRLETPHYIVCTLDPADATEAWGNWLTDPATARNLNARPERMSLDAIRTYIETFDRMSAHLLGIFEKETGQLIGIRALYIDWKHCEFLVNVLVGESGARNKGARGETSTVMYRYFFEDMGLEAARCSVVSTNAAILNVMARDGWNQIHKDRKPAADGQGFVDLHHFRLARDAWRRKESDRARAD